MDIGHPPTIGDYKIIGILGHGGMGTVYRAEIPGTGREVAIKLLNPSEPLAEVMGMTSLSEMFSREVLMMSRLRHPNIAEVLDFGFDHGRPYYTMTYYCNNLGMMIGEHFIMEETTRLIPPEMVITYGRQILAGLGCMHAAGIIHRDIKPYNMLVTERGTIRICDFGMARHADDSSPEVEGVNVGSPYYTAPEQIRNPENADARSDLYSTGALLYRMLTGELPAMKSFMLSQVNPLYDQAWDRFFARALNWKPDLRFQNGEQMATALMNLRLHPEKGRQVSPQSPRKEDTGNILPLRTSPVRVSGNRAREVFGVNRLWQPGRYFRRNFAVRDEETVEDQTTGLIWQRTASDHPLDRAEASELIEVLNGIRFGGLATWRLPTVNELLSLVNDPIVFETSGTDIFSDQQEWFWSCDRRSPNTSWFVNTRLAYTGWQNDGCQYSVRAVADLPA